jgi:hypothetical protein
VARIFLSYAASDKAIARKLTDDLTRHGAEVWLDQEQLKLGDDFDEKIVRNLEAAAAVVVLITPNSLRSRWVSREWRYALSRSTRLLPVLANGASFKDLPASLSNIQAGDLNHDYEGGLQAIVAAVNKLQSSADPPGDISNRYTGDRR